MIFYRTLVNKAEAVLRDRPSAWAIWLLLHWMVFVLFRQMAFNKSRNPAVLAE